MGFGMGLSMTALLQSNKLPEAGRVEAEDGCQARHKRDSGETATSESTSVRRR